MRACRRDDKWVAHGRQSRSLDGTYFMAFSLNGGTGVMHDMAWYGKGGYHEHLLLFSERCMSSNDIDTTTTVLSIDWMINVIWRPNGSLR
jgi:hypothetical protein